MDTRSRCHASRRPTEIAPDEPDDAEPDEPSDLSDLDDQEIPCTDDDSRWEAFVPDDDERDPEPAPGDFWMGESSGRELSA